MKSFENRCFAVLLSSVLLLCLFPQQERLAAQAKTEPKPGDLIMAQRLMPLTPLRKETFPDDGSVHRKASASVFMWPADLPAATHKANSILARMALLQYEPGGGVDDQAYADIRERAIYIVAGRARFRLGDSEKRVGAGDLVFAPSRVRLGLEVEGEDPLRIILMEWRSGDMSKKRSLAGTIVSEKLRPLTRLSAEDAGSHQGISASPSLLQRTIPPSRTRETLQWPGFRFSSTMQILMSRPLPPMSTTSQNKRSIWWKAGLDSNWAISSREVGAGELVYVPQTCEAWLRGPG